MLGGNLDYKCESLVICLLLNHALMANPIKHTEIMAWIHTNNLIFFPSRRPSFRVFKNWQIFSLDLVSQTYWHVAY